MKHLKTYENFEYFIELTYFYNNDEIMVDIKDGNVIDIYTTELNYIDFIDWEKGDNSLFVHCNPKDYYIILDELLNSDDVFLYKDEEEDDQFYDDIEEHLKKQLPLLKKSSNYNL